MLEDDRPGEMQSGDREINGPIIMAPLTDDDLRLERERVHDPSSVEAREKLALHTELTRQIEDIYPKEKGEELGDASLAINEPPSSSEEPTKETIGRWNELTRRGRMFVRDVMAYEPEVNEILSRNVGKEQLRAWLNSAFQEASRSYLEWTSRANDVPDPGDFDFKREQVMKMVQEKISKKLEE